MSSLDPRSLLSRARLYRLFRRLVAKPRRDGLVVERLSLQPGHRLLDIGCGTADILRQLPANVAYVGIDANPEYIRAARDHYGQRGEFHVHEFGQGRPPELGRFDRVLADGLLHHLDPQAAEALLALAAEVMRPGGCLVTIDPCIVEGQGWLTRRLLLADRGAYVRTAAATQELTQGVFADVRAEIHSGLLRFPYHHLLMECQQP